MNGKTTESNLADVRAALLIAFEKLPILPEERDRIPAFIDCLSRLAGKRAGRLPNCFLPASGKTVRLELDQISARFEKLASRLEDLHGPTRDLLADSSLVVPAWSRMLKTWATKIRNLDVPEDLKAPKRGRRTGRLTTAIGQIAAEQYEALTKKKATRVIDGIEGKPTGQFFEFVSDLFEILEVDGNAEYAVRVGSRRRKSAQKK